MVTLPPWLVGLCAVYIVSLTAIFAYLFHEQWSRLRALKAKARVDPLKLDERIADLPDPVEQAYADTGIAVDVAPAPAEDELPPVDAGVVALLVMDIYAEQTRERFKGIYGEDGQA